MSNRLSILPHYESAQAAFIAVVKAVLEDGKWVDPITDAQSIGSSFGRASRKTKELVCAGFAIDNPRARLIDFSLRRIDFSFAFANFIWTLKGDNEVASICHYNSKGVQFSEDGKHYAGAIGHRMQKTKKGSQLNAIIDILRADPTSRRAVIQFYSDTDSKLRPKDTPCVISIHLLLREAKLSAVVNMRSQSALMVMPYDIILYTMLQDLIASELGVDLGPYFHFCNSLHMYEDEVGMATAVVNNCSLTVPEPMAPMPKNSLQFMNAVFAAEATIRQSGCGEDYRGIDLPPFWHDIITVLKNAT